MNGSNGLLASIDLVQVEVFFFFLLLMRMAAHSWLKLQRGVAVPVPVGPGVLVAAVSLFVLGLSAFLIYGFGENYILLAVEFALILGLSILGPIYALSFFIALLFLRPWEVMQTNAVMLAFPRFMGLLCISSWFLHCLMSGRLRVTWNKSAWVMLFFTAWLFLTILYKGGAENQSDYIAGFLRVAIVYFLIVNVIEDSLDYQLLRDTILLSAAGLGAVAIYKFFALADPAARLSAEGSLGNSNDLAAILIMVLPFAVRPLLGNRLKIGKMLQLIFFLSITLTAVWLSQSRGAILAVLVMCASYFLFRMRDKKKALLLSLLVGVLFLPARAMLNRGAEDIKASTESRLTFWKAGVKMALYNPVFGVGYNNFPNRFEAYADEIKYEYGKRTAHSTWILALAESGFPGFALLVTLFFLAFRDAFQLRSEHPYLIYSMIGYCTAITFLSHTYILYPYILLALTNAAGRIQRLRALSLGPSPVLAAVILFFVPPTVFAKVPTLTAAVGGDKPIGRTAPVTAPKLVLKGSRGETLNFLLKLEGVKDCTRLSVDADTSSPENALRWRNVQFRFFEMPKVVTREGSFPGAHVGEHYDPLVPAVNGRVCGSGWSWGEAEIGDDAPPGEGSGFIRVENGPELPWKLEVWPMRMPKFPTVPAYMELTSWYLLLGHYGKWHEGEGELAARYLEEMRRHRIYPLKTAVKRPPYKVSKGQVELELDDGTKESFQALAVAESALVDFPTFDPKWNEAETEKYWRAVHASVSKSGFRNRSMVYFWDEPKPKDFPKLLTELKLAKKNAPGLKLMVTTDFDPRLAPYVDIFTPVMNHYDAPGHPPAAAYKAWRKGERQLWWYISCMSHGCTGQEESGLPDLMLDRPAAWVRSLGWLTFVEGIDAFMYYSVNNFFQHYPKKDPWKTLWDFHGNGEGTLFYPGRPGVHPSITEHQPVPSIRLKLWRESSFDAEYAAMMSAKKTDWWPAELKRIAGSTKSWSKKYSDYQALRDRAGAFLATQK
jgi:O-antigen ligase